MRPWSASRSAGSFARRRGELGQDRRIALPRDDRLEHGPARGPEDVARHRAELDVGVLEDLVDAVGHRRVLIDERGPVPGQIAQLADRRGREHPRGLHGNVCHTRRR